MQRTTSKIACATCGKPAAWVVEIEWESDEGEAKDEVLVMCHTHAMRAIDQQHGDVLLDTRPDLELPQAYLRRH